MRTRQHAFSLLELVIVVVIVGVISGIAALRLGGGADRSARAALTANLQVLNRALDLYATEHGGQPPSAANVEKALLLYSDIAGDISATRTATHVFGPYLRSLPPLPGGAQKGSTAIASAAGPGVGWVYDAASGQVTPNLTAVEAVQLGLTSSGAADVVSSSGASGGSPKSILDASATTP